MIEAATFLSLLLGYVSALVALSVFIPVLKSYKMLTSTATEATKHATQKVFFAHRSSHLDSTRSFFLQSEARGIINLAMIGSAYFVLSHCVRHWWRNGTVLGLSSFLDLVSRFEVFSYWFVLLGCTFLSVVFQKIFLKLNIPYLVQLLVHILFMFALGAYTTFIVLVCEWPLVSKAAFLIEASALMMKVHSYLVNNRVMMMAQVKQKKEDGPSKTVNQKKEAGPSKPVSQTTEPEPVANTVKFPENVIFGNYVYFLLVPTLVYELNYPQTEKFRPSYLLEKLMTGIGVFSVLHVTVDVYIIPVLQNSPKEATIYVVAELIVPITLCYILVFYLLFDCICNAFAEITKFGDRLFYDDFWNSTTMDEFARNWNRPVHVWLQRHVYMEFMDTFKLSKINAIWLTFLFSSIAHELLMILVFQMFRPWLFICQMAQVPMIIVGRELKGTRFGNCFFWVGIILGVPLLCTLYSREYYLYKPSL